jgi:hypothetical protein
MSKPRLLWLSGQTPPKHEDNEHTIDELRARIRKTVAFAESVREEQYAGASERKVNLSWAPGKVIGGRFRESRSSLAMTSLAFCFF